jgi:hypothetical protein
MTHRSNLFAAWVILIGAAPACAESIVIAAGETHTLKGDLVLDGDDVLDIRGTADKPCTLDGKRHQICSGPKWTGAIKITHCTIRELGGLPKGNPDNLVAGPGALAFERESPVRGMSPSSNALSSPYSDDDIKARKVGVSKMLAF